VEVDNTIGKFIDLARQMEVYFLQRRFQLSCLKPELVLKEENSDLRYEIARKDELMKKNAIKLVKWKEFLSDSAPSAPQSSTLVTPNQIPMIPGNPQIPQQINSIQNFAGKLINLCAIA
jgi:mediator of RNA polymerase II transcription subunit 28